MISPRTKSWHIYWKVIRVILKWYSWKSEGRFKGDRPWKYCIVPLSHPHHTMWPYLLIFLSSHLEGKAYFWTITARSLPSTEPGTEKLLSPGCEAICIGMVIRECSHQIHCAQRNISGGSLGQVTKAWAKPACSSLCPHPPSKKTTTTTYTHKHTHTPTNKKTKNFIVLGHSFLLRNKTK